MRHDNLMALGFLVNDIARERGLCVDFVLRRDTACWSWRVDGESCTYVRGPLDEELSKIEKEIP